MGNFLFTINKMSECKVLKDQVIIVDGDGNIDVRDFSAKPEIPFPHQGLLPAAINLRVFRWRKSPILQPALPKLE